MVSNFKLIRRHLKKILPHNIAIIPAHCDSIEKQEEFLFIADLVQTRIPTAAELATFDYAIFKCKDEYLITPYDNHFMIIRWIIRSYLGKNIIKRDYRSQGNTQCKFDIALDVCSLTDFKHVVSILRRYGFIVTEAIYNTHGFIIGGWRIKTAIVIRFNNKDERMQYNDNYRYYNLGVHTYYESWDYR